MHPGCFTNLATEAAQVAGLRARAKTTAISMDVLGMGEHALMLFTRVCLLCGECWLLRCSTS